MRVYFKKKKIYILLIVENIVKYTHEAHHTCIYTNTHTHVRGGGEYGFGGDGADGNVLDFIFFHFSELSQKKKKSCVKVSFLV